MGRLRSSRKTLLEKGYHTVYAYLYINKHTHVTGPLMETAKHEDIKIVSKEEMSPDQLVVGIDRKLQLAPGPKRKSGATKSLDETDSLVTVVSVPGKCTNSYIIMVTEVLKLVSSPLQHITTRGLMLYTPPKSYSVETNNDIVPIASHPDLPMLFNISYFFRGGGW